ncbi:hypothetical protein Q0590_08060 [Rhodocytophaga aerolata]|uniref:Glycosyltransferase RgtA/B/C/D-like domain-containing protein n=1 Tax=Rhodocytophaga aerolata TaxID=455078 RepID=A0ABT8R3F9_9BACT|nr:hypothetical protein [Rhodocytophaga aerolata]MDO1446201.1 hypothetical protein [Rhodocytophaga aerolata]
MIIEFIANISRRVFIYIEKFVNKPTWILQFALLCTFLCVCFSFPPHNLRSAINPYWKALNEQIISPLKINETTYKDPADNIAKRAFRLTMPVLGHIFGLKVIHLIIIQQICGVFFFIVLARLFQKITNDRVTAFLLVAGISFIYVGKACFWDIKYVWFDGIAYFLLTLAIMYSHQSLIVLFTLAACFLDERAVIASFFVYFWWKMKEQGIENFNFKSVFSLGKSSTAVLYAWAAYFLLRFYLGQKYGLSTPIGSNAHVGLYSLKINSSFIAAAIFTPIEFFWILLLFALIILNKLKFYFQLFLFLVGICAVTAVALSVGDVTRSLCYIFPSFFVALFILQKVEKTVTLRYIALFIALFNFIIGSYFVLNQIQPIAPSFKFFYILNEGAF